MGLGSFGEDSLLLIGPWEEDKLQDSGRLNEWASYKRCKSAIAAGGHPCRMTRQFCKLLESVEASWRLVTWAVSGRDL